MIGLSRPFRYPFEYHIVVHNRIRKQDVWLFRVRSPLTYGITIVFSSGY